MPPGTYGDDRHGCVPAFEEGLCLYDHKPGTLLKLSRYLHKRTGGHIDSLNDLICQTAQEAIETAAVTGTEAITRELLDDIRIGRGDSRRPRSPSNGLLVQRPPSHGEPAVQSPE